MYRLLRFVPKNHLSWIFGKVVHAPLPRAVSRPMIRWFAKNYGIDLDAAERPIDEYPTLGAFFIRNLKPGLRPVCGTLVSPVDGVLRNFGAIHEGRIEQVKGKDYSVADFLGGDEMSSSFAEGIYFNFYLSPKDYHHIHSPVNGKVVRSVHVPGKLWPVNDWSLGSIDKLFSINERIVTFIESEFGLVALVMVGATNVGKMTVLYDSFATNTTLRQHPIERRVYDKPWQLAAGDRLGTFNLGSTVVLLFPKGRFDLAHVTISTRAAVKYGEAILGAAISS